MNLVPREPRVSILDLTSGSHKGRSSLYSDQESLKHKHHCQSFPVLESLMVSSETSEQTQGYQGEVPSPCGRFWAQGTQGFSRSTDPRAIWHTLFFPTIRAVIINAPRNFPEAEN